MKATLTATALLVLLAGLPGCSKVSEKLNQFSREWDASAKTVTLYSMGGEAVKTYDIGRSKVTRAEDGQGSYIYFYAQGRYVQTNMGYVVESK
ncbi:MAG: hypothetical protein FJY99_05865 [Candidatus Sericytochromatia bacterium]|nr:hypothetical protein [Candidatus Tanganyikabacteria bacterium]